jgi:hypothetical protein
MAATITTTCPSCGTVVLERDDLLVVVDRFARTAWYLFDCAGCCLRVVKDAPPAVVSALTFAEVAVSTVPAEVYERWTEPGPDVDRLGLDDLLDAVLALRGTDDLAALAALPRPAV